MSATEVIVVAVIGVYGGILVRDRLRGRRRERNLGAPAGRIVAVAMQMAERHGRATVTPTDLVYTALFDDEALRSINVSTAQLEQLRSSLLEHLDALPAAAEQRPIALDASATDLLREAMTLASEDDGRELRPSDFVAAAIKTTEFPGPLLTKLAIRIHATIDVRPTESNPSTYRESRAAAVHQVVIWDDGETTMEHVFDVLTLCFGKSEPEALLLMLTIHSDGAATVGAYSSVEAADLASRANKLSRDTGMPLNLTLEASDFRVPVRSSLRRAFRRAVRRAKRHLG